MEFEIDECESIEDIELDSSGNPLPPKNDMIALIDADTLVFASCLACEQEEEVLGREFYNDDEWEYIISNPTYNPENACIYNIDLQQAFEVSKNKIEEILKRTGCKDYELHFTSGRESFRYTMVNSTYKQNRVDSNKRVPVGLSDLKDMFCDLESDKAFNWSEWEADDVVVTKKFYEPEKYLLVALDKDVLYSLPGRHFNYYSSAQYNIDMKFFEVDEVTAMRHHYKQCLTGDKADGVIGLTRVGPKTADKLLVGCNTPQECWEVVMREYEARGRDVIDAITNMRLVSMNQLKYDLETKEFTLDMWRPE